VIIVANSTKSEMIKDYAGLSKRNPLVALALMVALLSLAGFPLMAGFMAKFYVFLSAAQAGLIWLVAIGVVNSVISAYYYLRVAFVMYVSEGSEKPMKIDPQAAVALSIAIVGVLTLGIIPQTAMTAAARAAASLFGG
jgi:NADH-quinone oxidoreductase subunit N